MDGCGEVRSWCAVVMVDELGEEWTDEKLCRVTENVPTKVCLKEEEWRTLGRRTSYRRTSYRNSVGFSYYCTRGC